MKISNGRSKQKTNRKYFKLKDGEQVYRILPGLGDLADSNKWSVFYSVHYGYKTSDGKNRPFLSTEVKDRKSNTITVVDAAKDRLNQLKNEYEKAKKSGNEALINKLGKLVGQGGVYNLDNNHYLNVIDANGNIGVLKLRHKAKLALEAEIKKLEANNVYPLSPEDGRFFIFTRTGMGRDTTFSVNVLKEKIKVEGIGQVERDVVHQLDDSILGRLENEAAQLNKLFKPISASDVEQIVKTSDLMTGHSSHLDAMFDNSASAAPAVEESLDELEPDAEEEVAAPAPAPAPKAAAPQATVAPAATLAQEAKSAKTTVKISSAAPSAITEMSDDDFLARLQEGTL